MFMTMVWILALASAFIELYAAFKIPVYMKVTERFPLLALVVSITLSWFLGHIFGAAGLIALMGGLVSTMITLGCYRILAKVHDGTVAAKTAKFREDWESAKQLSKDLWKVIYFCIRVVTFPIWGYRSVKGWCSRMKARLSFS